MHEIPFKKAARIAPGERDHELDLDLERWPSDKLPQGWSVEGGNSWLRRHVVADNTGALSCTLDEALLRFPAAPIHGLQRLHEGHIKAGKAQNFQSYRILTGTNFERPVRRIFLLHNGLNELSRVSLYYELASHLISEDPTGTACVLRPFPGHLTRYPYHSFGEEPLDGYLWDGSHLFRQFIRHMVETQWFLSACVNRSDYRTLSGANLLNATPHDGESRIDPDRLAQTMLSAWRGLYKSSAAILKDLHSTQKLAPGMKDEIEDPAWFKADIEALREYLGINRYKPLDGSPPPPISEEIGEHKNPPSEPCIHVIGYSLGGFAAQSVFMSWPFVIDSCCTLLSGGPLRELAPTAFADPEEWQTVLHSLRYELDEAMTTRRFDRRGSTHVDDPRASRIAGMERDLFLYLQRTFYEVFQQEYRGSFQSRLAEYRQRMFFVVGGDDPIVRPQSVLDSAPPGGINLFEIAGLGHFIAAQPNSHEERGQREFWLPEIGKLITRFAGRASTINKGNLRNTWLGEDSLISRDSPAANAREMERLNESEHAAPGGALTSELFERHLDDLLTRVSEQPTGYLLILRNEVPTLLLDPHSVQRRARALHHDDVRIAEYCGGVERRWQSIVESRQRLTVILPWNAGRILTRLDAEHGFPSQSETAVGMVPNTPLPSHEWRECLSKCAELTEGHPESVCVFDGRKERVLSELSPALAQLARLALKLDQSVVTMLVPSMPDCWLWIAPDFLAPSPSKIRTPQQKLERLVEVALDVLAEPEPHDKLREAIQHNRVRVVKVSRARFNPRFRGRLVTDLRAVKHLLMHTVLCAALAAPLRGHTWDNLPPELPTMEAYERAPHSDPPPPRSKIIGHDPAGQPSEIEATPHASEHETE
jgi:pimeloyl-ACP methyl ester carboxylesterase